MMKKKGKKIKVVLFDPKKELLQELEIVDDLDVFYKLIGCKCIDIVQRKIGGKYFELIIDDEGLLKDNPVVSVIDIEDYKPMIVGNIILCHYGLDGELIDIDDGDLNLIKNNMVALINFHTGKYKNVIIADY